MLGRALRLAQPLGQRQHGRQALLRVASDPQRRRLLAPFVERALDLFGQHSGLLGIQFDPGDAEAAAAELDAAGTGQAELDPRLLQLQRFSACGGSSPKRSESSSRIARSAPGSRAATMRRWMSILAASKGTKEAGR